ncbi:hypothetical protein AM493_02590 [Flavobacterium akiainvivens]|uniref:HTH cro/C1-type domain-containing protein n=1 Tax=Flavobacterium akiainvivens TaxID=1202724 RepID=A0A0M8MB79_9FLAO|nr:helix-turn-helix transcriptional regulator [Flavobacterium akiainvivens]KOS05044.1 hypothetical protein AM493_02590 [Flavobacterium akiainvivens]SFQ52282.1 hypothetical protein SAMN05444144_106286 [Flavobacterium akiainvivens]
MADRKKEIPPVVIQVGERIKEIIEEKELIFRNVANDCNMDVEALRRYVWGKQIMGIDKLALIANALGIEVGELFKK